MSLSLRLALLGLSIQWTDYGLVIRDGDDCSNPVPVPDRASEGREISGFTPQLTGVGTGNAAGLPLAPKPAASASQSSPRQSAGLQNLSVMKPTHLGEGKRHVAGPHNSEPTYRRNHAHDSSPAVSRGRLIIPFARDRTVEIL